MQIIKRIFQNGASREMLLVQLIATIFISFVSASDGTLAKDVIEGKTFYAFDMACEIKMSFDKNRTFKREDGCYAECDVDPATGQNKDPNCGKTISGGTWSVQGNLIYLKQNSSLQAPTILIYQPKISALPQFEIEGEEPGLRFICDQKTLKICPAEETPVLWSMDTATLGFYLRLKKYGKDLRPLDFALMKAALFNDSHEVQTLLAKGASINIADKSGLTPLMYAVLNGSDKTIVALLQNKVSLDITATQGEYEHITALEFAMHGNYEAIIPIIRAGANVNALAKDKQPIVFHLLESTVPFNKFPEILTTMIQHKLNVNCKDKDGKSLLARAKETEGMPSAVLKILTAAGAK